MSHHDHQPIAHEIASLPFSEDEFDDVIVAGGAVMELHGLRLAGDIDLIIPIWLQNALQSHQPGRWERAYRTVQRVSDGTNFDLRWLRDIPAEPDMAPRFDIWAHWFDPAGEIGNRIITHEQVKKHTFRHELGFRAMELKYLQYLKERFGREKDAEDVRLIREYLARQ